MFNWFNKKNKKAPSLPVLFDLEEKPIVPGDEVDAFRYGLGRCRLLLEDGHFYYHPLSGGEPVSWLKMIDAATERQKVLKILQ